MPPQFEYNGHAIVVFSKKEKGKVRQVLVFDNAECAAHRAARLAEKNEVFTEIPCIVAPPGFKG